MAETVTIEIPVSVRDNTSAGLQSAQRNLTGFERTVQRTEQQLNRLDKAHNVRITADDQASGQISRISAQAEHLESVNPDIDVGVNNSASQTLGQVSDQAEQLDGASADVDVGANDTATPVINAAGDAVENFDGQSGSAEIGAEDNATPIIDSANDKGEAWDGSVFSATISIIDGVTAPLQGIFDLLRNPILQGASFLGVSLGAADTANTYMDFEATMSKVQALSNASEQDMERLTETAKEMGAVTKYSGTESAEAFTYMAQAGWDTQSMISGIGGIMSLAASDGIELAQATDIVANALTAFGLTASDTARFADVLAVASSATNTDVAGLGEAFKYVAPVAGALKYNIEDVSMALGLMSNNGIKGSMAGTALKTSLANLASPTDSMAAVMDKYNISLLDGEGNMKSLGEVMDNLRSSLGGLDEAEQTAAASTLFGKEAMAGMLSIINTSEEDYRSLAEQIENSAGAADRMAETMQDNLAGTLEQLGGAVETVQLTLGERMEPYISAIAGGLTDAMPMIEDIGVAAFDVLDAKFAEVQRTVESMTRSDEWQNADLFGKIDIAWNKIIAEPFMEWAGSDGVDMMSKGLGSLFSSAAKILPGGEQAGLTSWLSAGIIGMGASKLMKTGSSIVQTLSPIASGIKSIGSAAKSATSVGGFISNIGSMVPASAKFGIAAAAVTAAVVAITTALHNYTEAQKEASLSEHFGDIVLSAKEAEEVASGILNAKYLVNVDMELGAIEKADDFAAAAQEALEENEVLIWKSSVGIELTADEQQSFTDNIDTFVESKISELEQRTYAAHLQVETFLGGTQEGQTLADSIEEWASADEIELSGLSEDLQAAVEAALEDGIISVDEAKAVAQLQNKMNSITSRWKQAEEEAQMDWINTEYGNLSGKELTADSFTSVVEALADQRQAASETVEASAKEFYATLNAMEEAGRLTSETNAHYKELASQAIRNQQASDLMTSLAFETNTINDTYGDLLSKNQEKSGGSVSSSIDSLKQYVADGDTMWLMNELSYGYSRAQQGGGWGWTQSGDQNALEELWKSMKPDATAMTEMIDEYVSMGQAIPKQIMDSFNEAMEIGAASGDTDAAWQVYANAIAQSGDQALIDAVNEMDANGQLSDELSDAWKRATAEVTDEELTLDGLNAELGEVDVDSEQARAALSEEIQAVLDEFEAGGDTVEVTGSEVLVTLGEVSVNEGDALEQIASAVGMTVDELAEYNGIEAGEVDVGMTVRIPTDQINVDTAELNAAVDQTVAEASAVEPATVDASADVTVQANTVDTAPVEESAQTALDSAEGTTSATMAADVTVQAGETNVGSVVESVQSELDGSFASALPVSGSADVTLDQTNNSSDVYSQVGSDLRGAMSAGYSVSTNASIHVNYSIANPTASISFGGGGTGSATVTASLNAAGGEVGRNGPELSWVGEEGLEYIIPTVPGRRSRGIELWKAAGRTLGVLDSDGNISAHAAGGMVGSGFGFTPEDAGQITWEPENEDDTVWSVMGRSSKGDSSKESSEGEGTTVSVEAPKNSQGEGGNTFTINVDMSPVFRIDGEGMDDDRIMEVVQSRIREMADDLGDEIAERMSKIFANMPLATEA